MDRNDDVRYIRGRWRERRERNEIRGLIMTN
jgi:hypothetical protein